MPHPRSELRLPLAGPALALALSSLAGQALADPCAAVPERGPVPPGLERGAVFQGPVAYVGDGDSLCVATGRPDDTRRWVEVRLADFYGPELNAPGGREAKAALVRLSKDRRAVCRAQHRSYDRIVAVCRVDGRSLGDLMRAQGVREAGRGYMGAPMPRPR